MACDLEDEVKLNSTKVIAMLYYKGFQLWDCEFDSVQAETRSFTSDGPSHGL